MGGHVACMEDMTSVYKIFVGKCEEIRTLVRLDTDEMGI
jgi:hypothetical protein